MIGDKNASFEGQICDLLTAELRVSIPEMPLLFSSNVPFERLIVACICVRD